MDAKTRKDPWSWSSSAEFQETLQMPTSAQAHVINAALASFDQPSYRPIPGDNPHLFQALVDDITYSLNVDELFSTLNNQILDVEDNWNTVFKQFISFLAAQGTQMNPAHAVRALTRCTIPFNNDIFFDAVQFSNNRVTDSSAAAIKGFKEVAKKLCKQYIRRDFLQARKLFRTVEDICPVKRLAIYRAVKFLISVRKGDITGSTWDFNSENQEHNVYPTLEEKRQIDQGLEEIASSIFIDARIKIGDDIDSWSPPNHHQVQICCTDSQPIMGNAVSQSTPLGAAATNVYDFPSSLQQPPIPENEIQNWLQNEVFSACSNFQEESGLINNILLTSPQISTTTKTCPSLDDLSPSLPTNQVSLVVNFDKVSNDNYQESQKSGDINVSSLNENLQEFFPTPHSTSSVGVGEQITIGEHTYPTAIWNQAQREFDNNGTLKAGKYLFHELFTQEQKETMTWSGRHGTQKYPQTTVIAIIDALKHFENMSGKPERTPERYIVTKVFVETGSQIRNPKKTSSKP
ncbi:uncharacterized protein LOC110846229 isoform X2 [Folsomia candida]|nr:uncharacterized protein LOC110846229 isoform X2 [Folsomia candida]